MTGGMLRPSVAHKSVVSMTGKVLVKVDHEFQNVHLLLRRIIQGGYPRLEKVSYGDSLHGEIGCEKVYM
jgi:hypothetical protein